MASFYYTIVVTTRNQITEVSGVIEKSNIELARAELTSNGFLVRELRPAKQEEMALNRLYQFRNKLKDIKTMGKTEVKNHPLVTPSRRLNWPWVLFLLLVVALVILWIIMERTN